MYKRKIYNFEQIFKLDSMKLSFKLEFMKLRIIKMMKSLRRFKRNRKMITQKSKKLQDFVQELNFKFAK